MQFDNQKLNSVSSRRQIVLITILVEGGLAVLAWMLGGPLNQPSLADFHWDKMGFATGVVATLPMLGMLLVLLRWPIGPLANLKRLLHKFVPSIFAGCTLTQLALISLMAGIGEEILFRGVIQGAASRWVGAGYGLWIASGLFGLMHCITPTYVLVASLIGAYLGWLWQVSDNLLVPILAHALYDFLALVYFVRFGGQARSVEEPSEH